MALPQKPVRPWRRLAIAVAISVAIHLLLLPWLAKDAVFRLPLRPRPTAVGLVATPRNQVEHALRGAPAPGPSTGASQPEALRPQLPPAQAQKPEEQKPPKIDGQIVSLGQPQDERPPEAPTKYLSERDSRVVKETRARETSALYKNALSKVQREGKERSAKPAPQASPAPGQGGQGGGAQKPEEAQALELSKRERQDRVRIETSPDGTVRNREASDAMPGGQKLALVEPRGKQPPSAEGNAGVPGATPGLPGTRGPLKLTLDHPGEALGPVAGGPMSDDLRGLEYGNETLLNSRSFKYAGYLNRVKETVARLWEQKVQDEASRRDPTGQIYSYKDRRTVIEFSLDRMGIVTNVRVVSSSGVEFYDRVAVDAFRGAERFPNPPSGLIGENGLTLPFSFTLLAATGGLRMQIGPAYVPGSPASRGF